MAPLGTIMQITKRLTELKKANLNDPEICKEYVHLLLEMEKAIEAFEYSKIQGLKGEQYHKIVETLDRIMVGTDPKEVTRLLNMITEVLKDALKSVKRSEEADLFDSHKAVFGKAMRGEFDKTMLKELDAIQKREAAARKEKVEFETGNVLKSKLLLKMFKDLILTVEFDFDRVYRLKKALSAHYNYLAGNEDFFYFRENKAIDAAFQQLTHHMQTIDKHVEDQLIFIADSVRDILVAIDHVNRHTTLTRNMKWAFRKGTFDLQSAMDAEFKKQGVAHLKVEPLGIDYKKPWKTFKKEFGELAKNLYFRREIEQDVLEKIEETIVRIAKLIVREYEGKCDSPYHGVEHMSQVFVTSVRLYAGCFKEWKLDAKDLFVLAVAAMMHDTGYFVEKFKFVSPGYMSSMNHTFHEKKSAELCVGYLEHFKEDIEMVMGAGKHDAFVKSVQNVVSATQLFAGAFSPRKEKELQTIIRAADLMEMCSENYMSYIIPLYCENKIGNPNAPWPSDLNALLTGTPWFMNLSDFAKERVDPMIKYVAAYPQYEHNRRVIVDNLNKYFELAQGVQLDVQKITQKTKKKVIEEDDKPESIGEKVYEKAA